MHRTLFFIALTPIVFTLAACNPSGSGPRMLTKADAGNTANLKVGEHLEVALPANPTTGYTWEPRSLDTAILEQQESKYAADEAPPGLVGRGGMLTLSFRAVGAGQTQLQLIYHRTFEPDTPPAKTFDATIVVRN